MSHSKVTPVCRASFPHLDKPNMFGNYAITLLLPKSNPKVKEFTQWLKDAVKTEAISVAGEKGLSKAMEYFTAFKDGDKVESFKTYHSEYAGHWVITAGRKWQLGKPCVVNRQKQPIDPSEIYAGANVVAYIDVYGYNFNGKKSVSIGVQHVMKAGDNEPFVSTGVPVENAFDDIDLPDEDSNDSINNAPTGTNAAPKQQEPDSGSSDPFAGV